MNYVEFELQRLGEVNKARGPRAVARQSKGPSAAARQDRRPSAAARQVILTFFMD